MIHLKLHRQQILHLHQILQQLHHQLHLHKLQQHRHQLLLQQRQLLQILKLEIHHPLLLSILKEITSGVSSKYSTEESMYSKLAVVINKKDRMESINFQKVITLKLLHLHRLYQVVLYLLYQIIQMIYYHL